MAVSLTRLARCSCAGPACRGRQGEVQSLSSVTLQGVVARNRFLLWLWLAGCICAQVAISWKSPGRADRSFFGLVLGQCPIGGKSQ